jgi:hypothetical protein
VTSFIFAGRNSGFSGTLSTTTEAVLFGGELFLYESLRPAQQQE